MSPSSNKRNSSREPPIAEAKKRTGLMTIVAFVFVFAIAWLPIILSVTGVGGVDVLAYSIYNDDVDPGNGYSQLRSHLITQTVNLDDGPANLKVHPLISSLSVINGINSNSVLCVMGPSLNFSITDVLALVEFFQRGSCLIIADDFGTGNDILNYLAILNETSYQLTPDMSKASAFRFDRRLLLDATNNDGGKPLLPSITSFTGFNGVQIFTRTRRVVMNYATGIINNDRTHFIDIAMSSTNSWVTKNWDNPAFDPQRPPAEGGPDEPGPFTLIGMTQIGRGLLVLISDPSIFINDMIDQPNNDNLIFAEELFTFLARWSNTDLVIFDQNHLAWPPWTPVLYVGLMLGQITYASSHWLLAPLAPFLALWMVWRYLPFGKPKKEVPREVYRLKGQTLFTKTLHWYIENQRYDEAIRVIYGQLKRNLRRRHGLRIFDVSRLLVKISRTRQPDDIALLNADFQALERATEQGRRINREKFLDLFFKIKRIRENIG